MVSINVTKMSSKGQIVIPVDMRINFKEGDEFLIIKDGDRIILKKAENLTEKMKEDLEFARRTEEAWKSIERGEYVRVDSENLFEEMDKW